MRRAYALLFLFFAPPVIAQEVRTGSSGAATSLDPATAYSASSYTATVASGSDGFICANAGCRVRVAPTGTNPNAFFFYDTRFATPGTPSGFSIGAGQSLMADDWRPSTTGAAVGVTATAGLRVNGTTAIKGVVRSSVSVDFASIGNSACLVQSVTVTGAAVGDAVSVNADFALPTTVGIGNARVTGANTVDLRLCNTDPVSSADPAAGNYIFRLER